MVLKSNKSYGFHSWSDEILALCHFRGSGPNIRIRPVKSRIVQKNTEPQAVESGTLIIKAKNSAWRQELIFKQSEILESINKKLGKNTIKAIRFI